MIDQDAFFTALADPTRRRILALLQGGGERCVCTLYETLELAQPKVSRHLGVLRTAGIVRTRRAGLWVHYRIHPELPGWARAVLAAVGELEETRSGPIAASDDTCRPPMVARRSHGRRVRRDR